MNEELWDACKDPIALLDHLELHPCRRLRLLTLRCCREVGKYCIQRLDWQLATCQTRLLALHERFAEHGRLSIRQQNAVSELLNRYHQRLRDRQGDLRDAEDDLEERQRDYERAEEAEDVAAEPDASPGQWARAERRKNQAETRWLEERDRHKRVNERFRRARGLYLYMALTQQSIVGPLVPTDYAQLMARACGEWLNVSRKVVERVQCRWIRDIFGNPFRSATFDPAWRTTDVMPLANGIYAERAFDRMPILADALQDAGCDSDDILNHFRDPRATHVRGCWALDLVLGKE